LAYLLQESPDREMTEKALNWINTIPENELSLDDSGELALARALLCYQLGDSERALVTATCAVSELKRRGAANLVASQLQSGIGSIHLSEGEYEAAVPCFMEALKMASRLGNDSVTTKIEGNLALCFGRLGEYAQQYEWAGRALDRCGGKFNGYPEVQAAYSQGFACAMLGQSDGTMKVIETIQARMPLSVPPWQMQAWALWKADLFYLLGRREVALVVARTTLEDHGLELRTPAFAGPYARWTALTAESAHEKACAVAKLDKLVGQLDRFDALDQVDILCAMSLLASSPTDYLRAAKQRVSRMPPAVGAHLVSLGLIHV
jgi:tetratricopeptide (TPR) repeat protein